MWAQSYSVTDLEGECPVRVHLSFFWTNVARSCALLEIQPVSVILGFTSPSALVGCLLDKDIESLTFYGQLANKIDLHSDEAFNVKLLNFGQR